MSQDPRRDRPPGGNSSGREDPQHIHSVRYLAVRPPSTTMAWPVIKDASSEAKKGDDQRSLFLYKFRFARCNCGRLRFE